MAVVYIPTLLQELAGGRSSFEVDGGTVRQVVENLERLCPALRGRLVEEGRLRSGISVSVDGEISRLGLLERVSAESEVHFIAAVKGG
jgi:molybdopterin converting factor small subunit